jgi:GNAT superfamily N-acetyltransferase
MNFEWLAVDDPRRPAVARFMTAAILDQTPYISHSEILLGMSPDGQRWADDLEAQLITELTTPKANDALLVAFDPAICGLVSVTWRYETPPFALLQDIVAQPAGSGLGQVLYDLFEQTARAKGMRWIQLESGARNTRAHTFFKRQGLAVTSKVFMKDLCP